MRPKNAIIIAIIIVLAAAASWHIYASSSGATAPAGSVSQNTTVTVSPSDNGSTVTVHRNDRILLKLGDALQWAATVGDPSIISRVPNVMVVRGAQGLYTAESVGTTTLSAEGRPICAAGEMCPQFIQRFSVMIDVI
ncbi:MAG: hypothetical protein KGI79_00155 [Patescibacteria group bacterium]|nr:hypothetical protein [Patescibacteria group bacterium]